MVPGTDSPQSGLSSCPPASLGLLKPHPNVPCAPCQSSKSVLFVLPPASGLCARKMAQLSFLPGVICAMGFKAAACGVGVAEGPTAHKDLCSSSRESGVCWEVDPLARTSSFCLHSCPGIPYLWKEKERRRMGRRRS